MAGEKEKVSSRGTPSRYYSRHVLHMGGAKGRLQESETKEVETEGERQLKELLKKQLDTSTDAIHRDLHRGKRQFLPATTYQQLSNEVEGLRSLSQYQRSEKVHSQVDQLRQKGLSEDEIELALLGEGVASKRGKCSVEPEAHRGRMEAIQNKIEERKDLVGQDAVGSGVKQLSRHAMEVENSLFSGCEKVTLMPHLVALEQRKSNLVRNPTKLFLDKGAHRGKQECTVAAHGGGSGDEEDQHRGLAPPHHEGGSGDEEDRHRGMAPPHHGGTTALGSGSQEAPTEKREEPTGEEGGGGAHPEQDAKCPPRTAVQSSAGGDGGCIPQPLPVQVIERHRLTIDQLKALPRFRDYCPGEPSKVLYVKNIPSRTGEEDLQAVFGSCGAVPKVKLLSGRMRGQAFVEFNSVENASRAMELVNGYLLQDKPLVISYGHRRP